jgi:hypothetical protein
MREVYLQYNERLISQIRGDFISGKEVSALIPGSIWFATLPHKSSPDHFAAYLGVY